MHKLFSLICILCFLLLESCGSSDSKKDSTKESTSHKSFADAAYFDITPLADGGAYATEMGGGIWYLKGAEAIKVKEVAQLSIQPTSSTFTKRERALWALLQHERSKRKTAESGANDNGDNSGYSEPDPY